ncbi:MAG: DUF2934 domain-containing protein [Magnetococcales bacterium]|nr:DUF2934 domain-containing protein [Magnetococcales bacterium]
MNKLSREERIRQKAHDLWEQSGRPEGRGEEHWAEASRQVDRELEREAHAHGAKADAEAAEPFTLVAQSANPETTTAKKSTRRGCKKPAATDACEETAKTTKTAKASKTKKAEKTKTTAKKKEKGK